MMRVRVLVLLIGIIVAAAVMGWVFVRAVSERALHRELDLARAEFTDKHFTAARERLELIARNVPGRGDVEYLLGLCHKNEGHPEKALAAWARVPAGEPESELATLAAGTLALETGRYALAETMLEKGSRAGRNVGLESRRLLA